MRAASRDGRGAGGSRRVLLVALGTHGDVVPAVRLGSALERRGDRVEVAVLADGAGAVEDAGLRPLVVGPPAAEALWWRSATARTLALRSPGAMYLQTRTRLARHADGIAAALAPALAPVTAAGRPRAPGADLVLCGLAAAGLVPVLLRAGVPSRLVLHAPLLPHPRGTSAWRRDLSDVLPHRLEAHRQTLMWSLTEGLSSTLARAHSRRLPDRHRDRHGSPHPGRHLPALAPLLATSRVLDPEPSPGVVQTGWWADPGPVRPLSGELEGWLDRHPGAVLLSLGSTAQHDPERQVDRLVRVAALAGVPALLQVHGARPGPRPAGAGGARDRDVRVETLVVDGVDHRALLPHVRAVVHHGGSGTTHVAAAAGRPQLVVPHLGDQPHYGRQVARAGLGPPAVPHTRATAPALARALVELLGDPSYGRAAAAAAARMATEDGLVRAVDELAVTAPVATGRPEVRR